MDWVTSTMAGALVGRWHGRVDEANWQAFATALAAAVATATAPPVRFVIDLGAIDYMSSRGLRALSTALGVAKTAGVPMVLAAPGAAMREILAISRYDKLFAVHDSVAAAVAAPAA